MSTSDGSTEARVTDLEQRVDSIEEQLMHPEVTLAFGKQQPRPVDVNTGESRITSPPQQEEVTRQGVTPTARPLQQVPVPQDISEPEPVPPSQAEPSAPGSGQVSQPSEPVQGPSEQPPVPPTAPPQG